MNSSAFLKGIKMKKLYIFDLDGTLLDTIKSIAYYGNYALKINGILEIDIEEYKYFAGNGAKNLIKRMLKYNGIEQEEVFERVFKDYIDAYNKNTTYLTTIFDGLKVTLDRIKNSGAKLAVLSNKPHFATVSVTESLFGKGYFDLILGQRENIPIKPDPYGVFEIIKYFNVTKEECVYVGDTGTDMETGKSAGLYTVGVLWGFRKEDELKKFGADKIIKEPCELSDLI